MEKREKVNVLKEVDQIKGSGFDRIYILYDNHSFDALEHGTDHGMGVERSGCKETGPL